MTISVRSEPRHTSAEHRTLLLAWSLELIGGAITSRFLPGSTGYPSEHEWCVEIATMLFKISRTHQLSHLSNMIEEYKPHRIPRNSSQLLLKESTFQAVIGRRSFRHSNHLGVRWKLYHSDNHSVISMLRWFPVSTHEYPSVTNWNYFLCTLFTNG